MSGVLDWTRNIIDISESRHDSFYAFIQFSHCTFVLCTKSFYVNYKAMEFINKWTNLFFASELFRFYVFQFIWFKLTICLLLVLIGIIKYFMVGPQWTVRWNLVNQDGSKTRYKIFLEPGNKTTNWLQNFLGQRRGLSRTDSKDREVWWHPEELGLFIQCPLSGDTINEIQTSFILKVYFYVILSS